MMMSERDEMLCQLRPDLGLDNSQSLEEETFQNESLRPVLRIQNPLIIEHLRDYVHKFNPQFNAYGLQAQKAYLKEVIQTDVGLKNLLVSFVLGMLTVEEYRYYQQHSSKLRKRVATMLLSRIQDQIEKLL